MAKFPTYEEFGKQCAEYALDKYRYIGRTLREWIALITSTEDESGFDVGGVLMRLRSRSIMCDFCDNCFGDECEVGDVHECASWSAAQKAAELIEHLYADNCAKNAEIMLLTRERDEWKRRAEELRCDDEPVKYGHYGFLGLRIGETCPPYAKYGTCSNCRSRILIDPKHMKFCPECGMRMRETRATEE